MGTTFIKLGQFLATRPDIIGDELSKKLENLQDKLPPFSILQAKEIIKNDLGDETYNSIINLSDPVAAASIAQVHLRRSGDASANPLENQKKTKTRTDDATLAVPFGPARDRSASASPHTRHARAGRRERRESSGAAARARPRPLGVRARQTRCAEYSSSCPRAKKGRARLPRRFPTSSAGGDPMA